MKKWLLASVSGLVLAGAAQAADLTMPYVKAAPPPVANWAGFYLGIDIPRQHVVQAGFGRRRPKVDPVHPASATGTFLAAIAALISVYPTITFLSWNAALRAGRVPEVSAARTRRVRCRHHRPD